jgi:hypothetical protein
MQLNVPLTIGGYQPEMAFCTFHNIFHNLAVPENADFHPFFMTRPGITPTPA